MAASAEQEQEQQALATEADAEQQQQQQRIIGRWTIGATLGKGGYSWVKRGQDIKTGKIVALKFMEKADVSWVKEQAKQVETEIEALKNIRHQNVMKLYAYNLNAQYPLASNNSDDIQGHSATTSDAKGQKYIDTILLVLEYAPGGELFDILYYTSALNENVARTYFKQIIHGLEACHNANVVHRDLKPQNLLLDAKYNLKITDFGLSKIIQSDADAIMKTTYVGTRGYQAPELLLNQKYDLKCDIFSVGVILFILLAGYPPFEQASAKDKWFKPLIKGKPDAFWKAHQKSPIAQIPDAKDLLTKMLCFEPKKRIDMNGIKNHPWFKGETLKQRDLINEIRDRHRKAEAKRRKDARKMNDLAQSLNPNRPIPNIEKAKLEDFPKDLPEYFGEYTFVNENQHWYDIYNFIEEAITGKGQGTAVFDFEKNILQCTMGVLATNSNVAAKTSDDSKQAEENQQNGQKQAALGQIMIEFTVKVYRSLVWAAKMQEALQTLEANEVEQVLITRFTRTGGDPLTYNRIMKSFMLGHCVTIIKGLPKWARDIESEQEAKKQKEKLENGDEANKEKENDDEYDTQLANDQDLFTPQETLTVN